MKRGSLPSLNALLVFECAARHSNFSRAAVELNLTQGAVSQQIRMLEDQVGFALFVRARQRVSLTEQGRVYMIHVRRILTELVETTHRARALAGAQTLQIAVVPTFATFWLAARLPKFLQRHPELTIIFQTRLLPYDFRSEGIDAAIHNGEPTWVGSTAKFLMAEKILPVTNPDFRRQHGIRKPQDLGRVRLLHLSSRFSAWNDWFMAAGLQDWQTHQIRGLAFDQYGIMAEAAASGVGVALLPEFLIKSDRLRNRLEVLFPEVPCAEHSYHLVYPSDKPVPPALAAFHDWMLSEIRNPDSSPTAIAVAQPDNASGMVSFQEVDY